MAAVMGRPTRDRAIGHRLGEDTLASMDRVRDQVAQLARLTSTELAYIGAMETDDLPDSPLLGRLKVSEVAEGAEHALILRVATDLMAAVHEALADLSYPHTSRQLPRVLLSMEAAMERIVAEQRVIAEAQTA